MSFYCNIRVVLFASLFLLSCTKHAKQIGNTNITKNTETYFSVRQFGEDQWETYKGQPFILEKRIVNGDKTDTGLVSAQQMDWAGMVKLFFAADISDPKFLGKYKFSIFDENINGTKNFYYEATDPELFTRVFQITIDPYTDRIKAIYIETHKHSFWNDKTQKLYYSPLKTVQIQEFEKPLIGSEKKRITSYHFMI